MLSTVLRTSSKLALRLTICLAQDWAHLVFDAMSGSRALWVILGCLVHLDTIKRLMLALVCNFAACIHIIALCAGTVILAHLHSAVRRPNYSPPLGQFPG